MNHSLKMNKVTLDWVVFSIIGYTAIIFTSLLCLLPFILVVSGSFTSEEAIYKYGYNLWPIDFTTTAYELVFNVPDKIVKAYGVSAAVTVIGTLVGLFMTAAVGYVLNRKDFRTRNWFSLYFYFTTIFSGGLVPWYILMVKYLGMKDNPLALILPLLFSVFNFIIMRSFMASIPDALVESAKIDGAGDFFIFIKIMLPLSKAALATIGLFIALRYWNDWYNAMLFIQNENLFPLQYFLYQLLNSIEFVKQAASIGASIDIDLPSESFKLAMTVVATGPIVLLFPFLQKYFIRGLTVGAVKG